MQKPQWFHHIGCEKMRIIKYRSLSEKEVEKEIIINDQNYIRSLQVAINQLPVEGSGLMAKMAPTASYLTLEFACGDKLETIEFYNTHIKTPSTSFYSEKDSPDKEIWAEVQTHFEKPTFNKAVPKIKNKVQNFGDFSAEYLGVEDRTPKNTTATLQIESYSIIDNSTHTKQVVEIRSGQLPPKPQEFKVKNSSFILNTRALKDGSSIPDRMFVIYMP